MRRLRPTPLLLLGALAVGLAATAAGQRMRMSTVVDNMVGEAGDTPEARVAFIHHRDELCLVIAITTGPKALRAPLFRFSHRVEGEKRSRRLKFDLPKKPLPPQKGAPERVQVWETCRPALPDAQGSFIDLTYYDPRLLKDPSEHSVPYPPVGRALGVDVLKDSAGNLLFNSYDQPVQPDD